MAYGLEIKDASGNTVVTYGDRLTKILGTVSVSSSGSLTLPGVVTGNQYFFVFISGNPAVTGTPPYIRVSSGSLIWTYAAGSTPIEGTIHYGMY